MKRNYLLQTSHLWTPTSWAWRVFCTSFRFKYFTVSSSTHTSMLSVTCCQIIKQQQTNLVNIKVLNGALSLGKDIHLGTNNFGLWVYRWSTYVKSDIVVVYKSTCLFGHLAHNPWTNRWHCVSITLTHILWIVTRSSEHFVCWIGYQPMRPKELSPWI